MRPAFWLLDLRTDAITPHQAGRQNRVSRGARNRNEQSLRDSGCGDGFEVRGNEETQNPGHRLPDHFAGPLGLPQDFPVADQQ